MFDRKFFDDELPHHVDEKSRHSATGSVSVRLHLANGETVRVARVLAAGDGWALFEIYPRTGKPARRYALEEQRLGAGQFDLDRLALPFGVIVSVEITTEGTKNGKPGFLSKQPTK